MEACVQCFATGAEALLDAAQASEGTCALCDVRGTVWPTEAWSEALRSLAGVYQVSSVAGNSLGIVLTERWSLFSGQVEGDKFGFLDAVLTELGSPLRTASAVELASADYDAQQLWDRFAGEIKQSHRWFFPTRHYVEEALEHCVAMRLVDDWPKSRRMYRARVCPGVSTELHWHDMAAPPRSLASAGRANTRGLPVLYAATKSHVALYECRPSRSAFVAVSQMRATKPLTIANFAPSADNLPNPFDRTDEDPLEAWQILRASEFGAIVSRELSRPLRDSDSVLDYVPTQFVADFIASRGFDGLRYQSSFGGSVDEPAGDNIVLFDSVAAVPVRVKPEINEVLDVTWNYAVRTTGDLVAGD